MSISRRLFLQSILATAISMASVAACATPALAYGGKIVVANRASGSISVIDASSGQWIKDVPLPPGDNPPEPMYVVNTPLGNRVWVGDRANNRLVVFNGWTFKVVDTIPAGDGVFHMWADAFGRRMWVVNDVDKTVTVIDAHKLKVVATVPMPTDLVELGAKPHDVVLDPFGIFAYVTFLGVDPDFDVIVQFNAQSFQELNRTPVGKDPHVSFNWRSWEVYSPCQNSDVVFVLDGLSMAINDIIDVPGAHGAITSLDARRFYTTNLPAGGALGVICIDTGTNAIIDAADTPYSVPHNVALTPNGRRLFVTHSGANDKVSVFKVKSKGTLQLLGDVTVGTNPFGLAFVW